MAVGGRRPARQDAPVRRGTVPYVPDMTRPDRTIVAIAGLVASILVFVWPRLSLSIRGASAWYPLVRVLFVPLWCGIAAAVEAARGRIGRAALWLAVLAALILSFDVQGFTLIGHTPAYWPLFLLFAAAIGRSRWTQAACLLGILVVART